jgi:hypothetical protein
MLHAAHGPTAGTLHEAPTSTFAFAPFFLAFSVAMEGLQTRTVAIVSHKCALVIFVSLDVGLCYLTLLSQHALDVLR